MTPVLPGGRRDRLRALAVLLGTLMLTLAGPVRAAEEPRLALVIVNGAYQSFDRLGSTYSDGDKIATALNATGFIDASGTGPVQVRRDLTREAMSQAIADFRAKLTAAGPKAFGTLYFSGHGAALGSYGDVMLLPVDAGRDLTPESATMTRAALTHNLLGSGAKTVLIVLDMCRNVLPAPPPSLTQMIAAETGTEASAVGELAGSKGLRRMVRAPAAAIRPDQGYLVAFSTSADQVAFDDGIFSRILAEEIRRPQQNIADALKRVSDRVALSSAKNFQKPTFDYGLQGAPPCFISCDRAASDRFYDCASCPWMRAIPAGITPFGSPPSEPGRSGDEMSQADVKIDRPFAIGVYEVTIAEWNGCVRDNACPKLGNWSKENPNPLIPASDISYEDAQAFLAWLTVQSGRAYRLPSEQEWEYASRAGAPTAFPWGDDIGPSMANYDHTARYHGSETAPYRGYPEAVNSYPANAFGLNQMQGNMWEWTAGCTDTSCKGRIMRGGSFESAPDALRSANRFTVPPGKRRQDAGLRVVRDLDQDEIGGSS
ncbi:SUMF1/EgtB/PvdO family nonheme iron enzyme [Sphingobium sp. WCS2017Hpa-17]|uniref:SUMF1/EgtB/PvdO family nonheme iron enzyme n=1 Tax=Sphingobium sp. WCS2017Hpa-17 TaxID=3073638 RepID=UPI00288B80F2|nr:SUMF1/EgtB/PvdO family nonheme iron enzyme [Sphingobium sp. WCS2017Hpa-17]